MSYLAFDVSPAGIIVVNDTLLYDTAGNHVGFTTKCRPVPHMRMAVTGTGLGNVVLHWYWLLQQAHPYRHIDEVAEYATATLRQLQAVLVEAFAPAPVPSTATIYHFGQNPTGQFVWWAFRSTNDYEAERYDGGWAVKPPLDAHVDDLHPTAGRQAQRLGRDLPRCATIEEFVDMAVAVKAEQDRKIIEGDDAVRIGGELWMTVLSDDGFKTTRIHTFSSDDDAVNLMALCDGSCSTG